MRSIKENLLHRLSAQASEAELQGFSVIAESLTEQVHKNATMVRANDSSYTYPAQDFKKDLNDQLWNAILRIADFYDISRLDAVEVQELLDKSAQELISELCIRAGINHGIGAFEPNVPGEVTGQVVLEVD